MAYKFKKGDKVVVVKGRDAGKEGKIQLVDHHNRRLVVEGINTVSKHKKPSKDSQGGIVQVSAPIAWSNARLICPFSKKPTKVGFELVNGEKKRKSRESGEFF